MVENHSSNEESPFCQLNKSDIRISSIPVLVPTQKGQCELCHSNHHSLLNLRNHMIQEHGVSKQLTGMLDMELGTPQEDLFSYNNSLSGISQLTAQTCQILKCSKCGQSCKGTKGLNQHIAKSHRNRRKNAVCKECGRGFKDRHQLNFHIRQVHQGVTKVPCEYCGKMIYNKYALSVHIQKVHRDVFF